MIPFFYEVFIDGGEPLYRGIVLAVDRHEAEAKVFRWFREFHGGQEAKSVTIGWTVE